MTTKTHDAPAVGTTYRRRSTGRVWHLERITESGLPPLAEEFYGPDCDVRDYVSPAELTEKFDAIGWLREVAPVLPHTWSPWITNPVRPVPVYAPASP